MATGVAMWHGNREDIRAEDEAPSPRLPTLFSKVAEFSFFVVAISSPLLLLPVQRHWASRFWWPTHVCPEAALLGAIAVFVVVGVYYCTLHINRKYQVRPENDAFGVAAVVVLELAFLTVASLEEPPYWYFAAAMLVATALGVGFGIAAIRVLIQLKQRRDQEAADAYINGVSHGVAIYTGNAMDLTRAPADARDELKRLAALSAMSAATSSGIRQRIEYFPEPHEETPRNASEPLNGNCSTARPDSPDNSPLRDKLERYFRLNRPNEYAKMKESGKLEQYLAEKTARVQKEMDDLERAGVQNPAEYLREAMHPPLEKNHPLNLVDEAGCNLEKWDQLMREHGWTNPDGSPSQKLLDLEEE